MGTKMRWIKGRILIRFKKGENIVYLASVSDLQWHIFV